MKDNMNFICLIQKYLLNTIDSTPNFYEDIFKNYPDFFYPH